MPQMMQPPRESQDAKVQESKAQEPKTEELQAKELKAETAPIDFYKRESEVAEKNQRGPDGERKPPFQAGETVALQAEFQLNRDGSVIAVPVYPGGLSPRTKNTFDLGQPKDNPQLANLIGGTANLTVTIIAHKGQFIGHSFRAAAKGTPEIQSAENYSEEYLKTQSGRYVGVEGEVVAVHERSEHSPAQLLLRLADGQEITLGYHQSKLTYSGGVQDTISRKPVAAGDSMRVTAFVRSTGELSLSNNPYMTDPSKERKERYDNVRAAVGEHFAGLSSAIAAQNWQQARLIAGEVALLDTSRSERLSLEKLIGKISADERPIVSTELIEDGYARELGDAYDLNLFTMTKDEFIDFAADLGTGKFGFPESAPASYAYRLFDAVKIEPDVKERILTQSILALRPLVAGVETTKTDFMTSFMLDQGIRYLGGVNSPTASAFLVNELVQETTAGNFRRPNERPEDRIESIIFDVAASIAHRASENPFDRGLWDGIRNIKAVELFLRNNADEGWAVQSLQAAIQAVSRAMDAPMAINYLQLPRLPKV